MPRLLLAALVCTLASPLAAQEETRPPERPDSILTASERDAGFEAWRTMVAERARSGVSFLVEGDRFQVLMLTPMAIDALAPDSLIVKATKGCKGALELSDEIVNGTADIEPWAAFDSATRARPVVALAIYPYEVRRFDCHAGVLARFSAMSRGALYGRFASYNPRTDVLRAELRRGGALEPATLTGRAPVTKLDVGTATRDGTNFIRMYMEPDVFAPDGDGKSPYLEVHVWNRVDEEPEILPLPEQLIRAVWQQVMPWRAMTLATLGGPTVQVEKLQLAAPTDSVLRVAYDKYHAGDYASAAATALDRLMYRPRPPQMDIRNAMMVSASAFSAFGADEESISLVADVVDVYPCVTMSTEAPAPIRDMVERVPRKNARCSSIALPMIALRSIVPGGGQATGPLRRRMALTSLATTAGSYLAAVAFHAYGDGQYSKYERYDGFSNDPSTALFSRAQTARTVGNGFTVLAAGTWLFATGEGLWNEYKHSRWVKGQQNLGRPSQARGGDDAADATAGDILRHGDATAPQAVAAPAVRAEPRFTPFVAPNIVGISLRFR